MHDRVREIQGWSWKLGTLPLAWSYLESQRMGLLGEEIKSKTEKNQSKYFEAYCKLMEEMAALAYLDIKIPDDLSVNLAFEKLKGSIYRSLLPYGIETAEILLLSFHFGVYRWAPENEVSIYTDTDKADIRSTVVNLSERSKIEVRCFSQLVDSFLSGSITPMDYAVNATDTFFDHIDDHSNNINPLIDSIELNPSFLGLGIDLKKLYYGYK